MTVLVHFSHHYGVSPESLTNDLPINMEGVLKVILAIQTLMVDSCIDPTCKSLLVQPVPAYDYKHWKIRPCINSISQAETTFLGIFDRLILAIEHWTQTHSQSS